MFESTINWLAVLVTAVAYMAVGALWYGPLFQKPWMRLTDTNEQDAKAGAGKAYAMMFVVAFITSYILAHFVDYTQATSFIDGAITGFWLCLGFQATIMLNGVIFEKKPFQLYLINVGYNLVMLLIGGGILAVWQ